MERTDPDGMTTADPTRRKFGRTMVKWITSTDHKVIGYMYLIASFAAIDYTTIVVNLGLIAAIVLLPFSTQAVGNPGVEDLPLPTVIMAVNVVAASALHTLVYAVAVRRNLLSSTPSRGEVSDTVVNGLASAAVFGASVPIAYLISPAAAQITWISLIPISWLLDRYTARWRRATDAA